MRPQKVRRVVCLSCLSLFALPLVVASSHDDHRHLHMPRGDGPLEGPSLLERDPSSLNSTLGLFLTTISKAVNGKSRTTSTPAKVRTTPGPSSSTPAVASGAPPGSAATSNAAGKSAPTSSTKGTTILVTATSAKATSSLATTTTSARTVNGVGWYPQPTSFVKRSTTQNQAQLTLDGKTYRAVGFNAYWLGLDENVQPSPAYPARSRVREVFAIAVAMGANTVRCMTCGVSTGNSLSVMTGPSTFNQKAFASIDYAIYAARQYGVRLVIPLTDQYAYYHGGKLDFLRFSGQATGNGNLFYSSTPALNLFHTYITALLNHVNQYTGIRLGDDPTIMAWESGNEFGAYMLQAGSPPSTFTNSTAALVKQLAPNHLFMDGSDGVTSGSGQWIPGLAVQGVDIVSNHLYPLNTDLSSSDLSVATKNGKALYWGEFDWTQNNGGSSLSSFLTQLESTPYAGAAFWSVMSHSGDCSTWVEHQDGYSMYWNSGSSSIRSLQLAIAQTYHRLTGRGPPSSLNPVTCPQPPLPLGGA